MPESIDLPTPASALVVVAHPDDAEFQCGATLAKWARSGCVVHHLVLTDGSKGTWDPDADQEALVARRVQEQHRAAELLGADGEVVMLGSVDGELVADTETRASVAAVIRRLAPEVILGHDPWRRYRLHPDHAAAGRLVIDGIVAARDPFFHREQLDNGLEVHRPEALLLFEADVVNHHETLDEADVQAKLSALEAHESQMETTHFYRIADDTASDPTTGRDEQLARFRSRQRERLGEVAASIHHEAAEAFHLMRDQL
ncbi:MAG: PIG-L deacetylase family protein [Microthrixaceae bacterium]